MTELFFSAILLGLGFAAPPGPVTVEAVRRGLIGGFMRSFMVGLGSLFGDSVWAVVALGGVAFVIKSETARVALGLVGALWLAWLAFGAVRAARAGHLPPLRNGGMRGGDLAVGAIAALANPYVAAFWLAVGGGVTVALLESGERLGLAVFFAGFLVGCVVWCAFLSFVVAIAHQRMTQRFLRSVNLFAGLILGSFALLLIWKLADGSA